MTMQYGVNEARVYRQFSLPVSAFDVLKGLQRAWGVDTNAEVVTRLLMTAGREMLMKNEGASHAEQQHGRH